MISNISEESNEYISNGSSFINVNNASFSNPYGYSFNNNHYQESQPENQNDHLLNSLRPDSNNNNINSFDSDNQDDNFFLNELGYKKLIDQNSEQNSINQDFLDDNEYSKFILYLKNNNFISNNNILDNDLYINQDKKNYEQKLSEINNKLKCKGCSKIPNEFFICSFCHEIFCQNCLGNLGIENGNFCINCNKIVASKDYFINMPIFEKITNYINNIKGTNEKFFNNKIKNNLDKSEILCCDNVHKLNTINKEDSLEININNNIKNGINLNIQSKATYFCMTCLKPFCSDCILNYKINHQNQQDDNIINDNNIKNIEESNEHSYIHPTFKINLLKNSGIFDLLYEKSKCQKIIAELESFEKSINNKIDYLSQNKENMILFLEYIKNLYVNKVDEVINNLKTIYQEKNEKIQKIKEKSENLSNFLKILKTKNDLINKDNINSIKSYLDDFVSFHKIPYEIKKNSKKLFDFNGELNLENVFGFSYNLNLKQSFKKKFTQFNSGRDVIVKYKNSNKSNNIINKDEENNNNQIIEEKNIVIILKQKENNKIYKKLNQYYSYPVLINKNNKNEFILLRESKKNDVDIEKNENKKEIAQFNIKNDYNDDSFNSNPFKIGRKSSIINEDKDKKIYLTDINVKNLKKINDDLSNINCEIYHINIF